MLLRHGTANATKAQNAQLGALAGAIAGAVIADASHDREPREPVRARTPPPRYSRDYEKQADSSRAANARAGYAQRPARMFERSRSRARAAAVPPG